MKLMEYKGILSVDKEMLAKMCIMAHDAYKNREKIFEKSREEILPQWNLPRSLEYNPKRIEVLDPLEASKYLLMMASLERKSQTRVNIINGLKTWNNPKKSWIFDPHEVSKRSVKDIEKLCKEEFNYTLNKFAEGYHGNMRLIDKKYGRDPRKIIQNQTVEQARKNLMELKNIGTGIANLFITYLKDRRITFPIDESECLVKVDVHKARLPLNINCIETEDVVRRNQLQTALEKLYLEVCKNQNISASELDAALWIIGSEICSTKNYENCLRDCPLEEICVSNIPENEVTGKFTVSKNGTRVESRRNIQLKNQLSFELE